MLSFWNHRNYQGKQGDQQMELGGERNISRKDRILARSGKVSVDQRE